jgi:hypothetical protein
VSLFDRSADPLSPLWSMIDIRHLRVRNYVKMGHKKWIVEEVTSVRDDGTELLGSYLAQDLLPWKGFIIIG